MVLTTEEEMSLSDEEFNILMEKFEEELDIYVKGMLEGYITHYIGVGYKMSCITENTLETVAITALALLSGSNKLYDLNCIKKRLEEEYKLQIVNDEKLTIKEI